MDKWYEFDGAEAAPRRKSPRLLYEQFFERATPSNYRPPHCSHILSCSTVLALLSALALCYFACSYVRVGRGPRVVDGSIVGIRYAEPQGPKPRGRGSVLST